MINGSWFQLTNDTYNFSTHQQHLIKRVRVGIKSHFQAYCFPDFPNLSPSSTFHLFVIPSPDLNPIFPVRIFPNPRSHFTLSGPSIKTDFAFSNGCLIMYVFGSWPFCLPLQPTPHNWLLLLNQCLHIVIEPQHKALEVGRIWKYSRFQYVWIQLWKRIVWDPPPSPTTTHSPKFFTCGLRLWNYCYWVEKARTKLSIFRTLFLGIMHFLLLVTIITDCLFTWFPTGSPTIGWKLSQGRVTHILDNSVKLKFYNCMAVLFFMLNFLSENRGSRKGVGRGGG